MAKKRSYGIQLVITGKNLAKATLQGLAKGLQAPIDAVKKLGAGFGSLVEKVPGIYLLGRAVGSVARETVALVRGLGDYAGDVIDLSARTGIGTDLLQEFGFAAQKVGINTEQSSAACTASTASTTSRRPVGSSTSRSRSRSPSRSARCGRFRFWTGLGGVCSSCEGRPSSASEVVAWILGSPRRGFGHRGFGLPISLFSTRARSSTLQRPIRLWSKPARSLPMWDVRGPPSRGRPQRR